MKEFDQKDLSKIVDALSKNSVELKAGKKNGVFEFIITSEHVDRHGDIVERDGMNIDHYMKNPVVLWSHEYWTAPIGKCTSLERVEVDGVKALKAKGFFAGSEDGQKYRKLYDEGMLNTTSIGFISKGRDENDVKRIIESELLEFSIVPVPANPHALNLLKEKGMHDVAKFYQEISTQELPSKEDDGINKDIDQGVDKDVDDADGLKKEIENLSEQIGGIKALLEELKEAVKTKSDDKDSEGEERDEKSLADLIKDKLS